MQSAQNSRDAKRKGAFLIALFLFLVMDVLLFRTGWYFPFIKPDSSAGVYKYRLQNGKAVSAQSHNLVAVVGDSRIGEGFSARVFDEQAGPTSFRAVNLAVPGSSLRVWYYLLSQIDPNRNAFKLIVIPMTSYSENDQAENFHNRILDLQFLMPFASMRESVEIIRSFSNVDCQLQAIGDSISKLYALNLDVKDFLLNPKKRMADVALGKKYSDYNYSGANGKLQDYLSKEKLTEGSQPAIIVERLKARFNEAPVPQSGENHQYNSYWLNRLVEDYKNSDTTLVLIKIPIDPIGRLYQPTSIISVNDYISGKNKVVIAPEKLFADLENPRYFFDDLHLNKYGRKIFSDRITQLALSVLVHPPALAEKMHSENTSQ